MNELLPVSDSFLEIKKIIHDAIHSNSNIHFELLEEILLQNDITTHQIIISSSLLQPIAICLSRMLLKDYFIDEETEAEETDTQRYHALDLVKNLNSYIEENSDEFLMIQNLVDLFYLNFNATFQLFLMKDDWSFRAIQPTGADKGSLVPVVIYLDEKKIISFIPIDFLFPTLDQKAEELWEFIVKYNLSHKWGQDLVTTLENIDIRDLLKEFKKLKQEPQLGVFCKKILAKVKRRAILDKLLAFEDDVDPEIMDNIAFELKDMLLIAIEFEFRERINKKYWEIEQKKEELEKKKKEKEFEMEKVEKDILNIEQQKENSQHKISQLEEEINQANSDISKQNEEFDQLKMRLNEEKTQLKLLREKFEESEKKVLFNKYQNKLLEILSNKQAPHEKQFRKNFTKGIHNGGAIEHIKSSIPELREETEKHKQMIIQNLEEFLKIIASVFQSPVLERNFADASILEISGSSFCFSEVCEQIKAKFPNTVFEELRFYGGETLFLDTNLTFPGCNIMIKCKTLNVYNDIIIDVSGKNALEHPKKAQDGKDFRSNSNIPSGTSGKDGLNGEAGGSSGDVYIEADKIIDSWRIKQVRANGGNGGAGQDGGDGDEGQNGCDGKDGQVEVKSSFFVGYSSISRGGIGEPGKPGGKGGNAGLGGEGGYSGNVLIKEKNQKLPIPIEKETGKRGENGKPGLGGKGGLNGRDGCDDGFTDDGPLTRVLRLRGKLKFEKRWSFQALSSIPFVTLVKTEYEVRNEYKGRAQNGRQGEEASQNHHSSRNVPKNKKNISIDYIAQQFASQVIQVKEQEDFQNQVNFEEMKEQEKKFESISNQAQEYKRNIKRNRGLVNALNQELAGEEEKKFSYQRQISSHKQYKEGLVNEVDVYANQINNVDNERKGLEEIEADSLKYIQNMQSIIEVNQNQQINILSNYVGNNKKRKNTGEKAEDKDRGLKLQRIRFRGKIKGAGTFNKQGESFLNEEEFNKIIIQKYPQYSDILQPFITQAYALKESYNTTNDVDWEGLINLQIYQEEVILGSFKNTLPEEHEVVEEFTQQIFMHFIFGFKNKLMSQIPQDNPQYNAVLETLDGLSFNSTNDFQLEIKIKMLCFKAIWNLLPKSTGKTQESYKIRLSLSNLLEDVFSIFNLNTLNPTAKFQEILNEFCLILQNPNKNLVLKASETILRFRFGTSNDEKALASVDISHPALLDCERQYLERLLSCSDDHLILKTTETIINRISTRVKQSTFKDKEEEIWLWTQCIVRNALTEFYSLTKDCPSQIVYSKLDAILEFQEIFINLFKEEDLCSNMFQSFILENFFFNLFSLTKDIPCQEGKISKRIMELVKTIRSCEVKQKRLDLLMVFQIILGNVTLSLEVLDEISQIIKDLLLEKTSSLETCRAHKEEIAQLSLLTQQIETIYDLDFAQDKLIEIDIYQSGKLPPKYPKDLITKIRTKWVDNSVKRLTFVQRDKYLNELKPFLDPSLNHEESQQKTEKILSEFTKRIQYFQPKKLEQLNKQLAQVCLKYQSSGPKEDKGSQLLAIIQEVSVILFNAEDFEISSEKKIKFVPKFYLLLEVTETLGVAINETYFDLDKIERAHETLYKLNLLFREETLLFSGKKEKSDPASDFRISVLFEPSIKNLSRVLDTKYMKYFAESIALDLKIKIELEDNVTKRSEEIFKSCYDLQVSSPELKTLQENISLLIHLNLTKALKTSLKLNIQEKWYNQIKDIKSKSKQKDSIKFLRELNTHIINKFNDLKTPYNQGLCYTDENLINIVLKNIDSLKIDPLDEKSVENLNNLVKIFEETLFETNPKLIPIFKQLEQEIKTLSEFALAESPLHNTLQTLLSIVSLKLNVLEKLEKMKMLKDMTVNYKEWLRVQREKCLARIAEVGNAVSVCFGELLSIRSECESNIKFTFTMESFLEALKKIAHRYFGFEQGQEQRTTYAEIKEATTNFLRETLNLQQDYVSIGKATQIDSCLQKLSSSVSIHSLAEKELLKDNLSFLYRSLLLKENTEFIEDEVLNQLREIFWRREPPFELQPLISRLRYQVSMIYENRMILNLKNQDIFPLCKKIWNSLFSINAILENMVINQTGTQQCRQLVDKLLGSC